MINLKECRLSKRMTMKEVAQKIGISECYYSLIENGERRPSVEVAKKMAIFYEFPWTKFFED